MRFFTHEINSRNDDRVFELIDIHGLGGYGFYWVILEELYRAEDTGFQVEATNVWMKRLARSLNITDDRTIIRYFDTLADLGLINKQLWQEHIIYSQGVMDRADNYMQRKAKEANKKRNQRVQSKANIGTLEVVPRDNLGTNTMSLNVPLADPHSDPDPNSESFFLRAQGKETKLDCIVENIHPEQKKEILNFEDNQDRTPPIASRPPKFIDPYVKAMEVRQRKSEIDKMTNSQEFLKFLISVLKRSDYYKNSCDASDSKKWVRVSLEAKNDKCDSRWDEVRDRYQDFLESQTPKQHKPAIAQQSPIISVPVPINVKEYAANLVRKSS